MASPEYQFRTTWSREGRAAPPQMLLLPWSSGAGFDGPASEAVYELLEIEGAQADGTDR